MLLEIKGVLRVKYILNKVFTVAESIMLFIPVESHFDKRKTLRKSGDGFVGLTLVWLAIVARISD